MDMRTALVSGLLIDGTDRAPLEQSVVIIEGDRITAVTTMAEVGDSLAEGTQIVDCANKTLIPGLIDAHVHLTFSGDQDVRQTIRTLEAETAEALAIRTLTNAQQALKAGITTVRDCGGRGLTTLRVRDAIHAGLAIGPRILACGMPITPTAGHLHWCGLRADGEDGVRHATRQMVEAGADFIKMMATGGYMTAGSNPRMPQYTAKEMALIVEEAHRLGRHVAAHVLSAEGVRRAVQSGVDTLEHCMWHKPGDGDDYDLDAVANIVQAGRYVTMARGVTAIDDDESLAQARELYAPWRDMIARGVKMILATDAGISAAPRCDLLPQVALTAVSLLDMTPMEVIAACTRIPAQALWVEDEIGTLEPGKKADIVILNANPLEDIQHLQAVHGVFVDGKRAFMDES